MPISAYLSGAADAVLKGMSTLVPEKRVNKNGVLVTRHIKPQTMMFGKTIVPPPAITRSVIAEGVIEGVLDSYASNGKKAAEQEKLGQKLKALPDSTLNFVSSIMNKDDRFIRGIDNMIASLLEMDMSHVEMDDALYVFDNISNRSEYNRILKVSVDHQGGEDVGVNLRGLMRGLSAYTLDGFNYESGEVLLRQQSLRMQQQVSALIEAAQVMPAGSLDGVYTAEQQYTLRNKELAQILVDFPDQTDSLLELVKERGEDNLAAIREIMSSSTPSLREGIL